MMCFIRYRSGPCWGNRDSCEDTLDSLIERAEPDLVLKTYPER